MKFYTHTQSSPSPSWSITHNLNCKPVVEVMIDVGGGVREKVYPKKVLHSDDTTMILEFSVNRTGVARLAGTGTAV